MNEQIQKHNKSDEKKQKPKFKELVEQAMINKKGKVLVIEDDEKFMEEILKKLEGKQVVTAKTLVDANVKFDENPDISLVITDMSYPEREGGYEYPESGDAMIRYVKDKRPGVKVIAQSSLDEYLEMAKEAGADETIKKKDIKGVIAAESKKEGKVLLVCEGAIKDRFSFSGIEVDYSNLHDAEKKAKVRSGEYSKIFVIGDSRYISYVRHDIYHVAEIPIIAIQTDDEEIHLRGPEDEHFKMPLDTGKLEMIGEALGGKVEVVKSKEEAKKEKIMIVAWDSFRWALQRVLDCIEGISVETCAYEEFSEKDIGEYKTVLIAENEKEMGEQVRSSINIANSVSEQKTKIIFLRLFSKITPNENEVILKQPVNLAELLKELKRD